MELIQLASLMSLSWSGQLLMIIYYGQEFASSHIDDKKGNLMQRFGIDISTEEEKKLKVVGQAFKVHASIYVKACPFFLVKESVLHQG